MADGDMRRFTKGQARAMEALRSGRNVFLTGSAGTGKSFVLNAFIEELGDGDVPYLAMAPTGIAAQNLANGTTIHRTLQVGFGILDPTDMSRKTLSRKVLKEARVIIIDEVSMCRVDLFERVMNMVLDAKKVSGPKQVVLVGDFFHPTGSSREAQAVEWSPRTERPPPPARPSRFSALIEKVLASLSTQRSARPALSGMLTSASPGITAAIICGFLAAVLAKPTEK